jgi:hypothetical protein
MESLKSSLRRATIIVSLLALSLNFVNGQISADSITMKKGFGGYQFFQGEQRLNMKQLVSSMKPNDEAYRQIKSAQSNYTLGLILGYTGGFLIGWPIGTALGGGEPNWALAGVGAGLIVLAIPVSQGFNKKAKQAVATYNRGLRTTSFWDKNALKVSINDHGVGLTLTF